MTYSVIKDSFMISMAPEKCTSTSYKGQIVTNNKETLRKCGDVWLSTQAIINILSLVIVDE